MILEPVDNGTDTDPSQTLTDNADLAIFMFLHQIRTGNRLSNAVRVFLIFFFAGLVHSAGDYMAYNDTRFGAMVMLVLQACAVIVEDLVQQALANIRGRPLGKSNRLWRVLGRVYVLLFTVWSWGYWVRLHLGTSYADEMGDFGLVKFAIEMIQGKA